MSTTPAWRALSDAEFAAAPEASLGGPLGLIFAAAVALVIIAGLALFFILTALIGFGGMPWSTLLKDLIAIPADPRLFASRIVNLQQAAMVVWAAVFVVMTLMRAPSTPKVASVLMVIWVILAMTGNAMLRHVGLTNGLDMFTILQMTPYILFNVIITAAFWGYMQDGRWPNIYYVRRVRA